MGYNNQFTVVQKKICKLFVKDNYDKFLGINPMVLSSPMLDSIDFIAWR